MLCTKHPTLIDTQCDEQFPCKKCKDSGLVCTEGIRKKAEFKQRPKGYVDQLSRMPITATKVEKIRRVSRKYPVLPHRHGPQALQHGSQWEALDPR